MKKNGFTLIELLITILIIAILATYSILAYIDSIYEAENKQAKSKLEVIHAGLERYRIEYPADDEEYDITAGELKTVADAKLSCVMSSTSPDKLIHCGYIPRMDFDSMKYSYFVRDLGAAGGCGSGYAYMLPRSGKDVGGKYTGSYCAGIDNRGNAIDASI